MLEMLVVLTILGLLTATVVGGIGASHAPPPSTCGSKVMQQIAEAHLQAMLTGRVETIALLLPSGEAGKIRTTEPWIAKGDSDEVGDVWTLSALPSGQGYLTQSDATRADGQTVPCGDQP